jgi:hypothetical protein
MSGLRRTFLFPNVSSLFVPGDQARGQTAFLTLQGAIFDIGGLRQVDRASGSNFFRNGHATLSAQQPGDPEPSTFALGAVGAGLVLLRCKRLTET